MKIIIGLGNPGKKYQNTRHNLGFLVVDKIREKLDFSPFVYKEKFQAEISEGEVNGERVILVKPQTYMNKSGESVNKIVSFYKVDLKDILVILDDINLLFGKIRIRMGGSSGGHKGLQSVIDQLKNKNFLRIRVGIGNNLKKSLEDYVLSNFNPEEMEKIFHEIVPFVFQKIKEFLEKGKLDNQTEIVFKNE